MSTPVKSTPVKDVPVPDSPGTWRHPRIDEITRRRNAATFSEQNVRRIAYNVAALLALWFARLLARLQFNKNMLPSNLAWYSSWIWFIAQLVPLTAAQRQLLGLPPTPLAEVPSAIFSTPPRYSRTPSIRGSIGSRGSFTSSPLSGRGSPIVPGTPTPGGSEPMQGSPLFQRSIGNFGNNRRSSFGSSAPFGNSVSHNLLSEPGSPTAGVGKRTSVGLNNKWLYERGRRSSSSAWAH